MSHPLPPPPEQQESPSVATWGWPSNLLNLGDLATTTSNAMSVLGISESPKSPRHEDAVPSREHSLFGLARIGPPVSSQSTEPSSKQGDSEHACDGFDDLGLVRCVGGACAAERLGSFPEEPAEADRLEGSSEAQVKASAGAPAGNLVSSTYAHACMLNSWIRA